MDEEAKKRERLAYLTLEDYEKERSHAVSSDFKMGWRIARLTEFEREKLLDKMPFRDDP